MKKMIISIFLCFTLFLLSEGMFDCELPVGCKIDYNYNQLGEFEEKMPLNEIQGIRCEIKKDYKFRFNVSKENIFKNIIEW